MSMTENEAQKWLERFEWDGSEETSEALATICEALQEYPKFRAIGTVESYEKAIQATTEYYLLMKEYKSKVQDFEAIGTIEEFKALKEKNEPKRLLTREEKYPQNYGMYSTSDRWCPCCKRLVFTGDWSVYKQNIMYKQTRCGCGQKIDWQ